MNIKDFRENAGLRQNWVAQKLGVTSQTIINWEQGKTKPNTLQAAKLAELYHVTLDELVKALIK